MTVGQRVHEAAWTRAGMAHHEVQAVIRSVARQAYPIVGAVFIDVAISRTDSCST